MTEVMKVVLLIPSLEQGGAERQLIELVKGIDRKRFDVTVATFQDGGVLRTELANNSELRLVSLKKRGQWDLIGFCWRSLSMAFKIRPDVMVGYLNLPSILCLFLGRAVGARVVWSLRASDMDLAKYSWAMRRSFRLGAWLSRFADLIVVNSHAGKHHHSVNGYDTGRMVIIPNGIDVGCFCPTPAAGGRIREQWGISKEETVIGLVGRLDITKDHPTFLRAAAHITQEFRNVRFVCVGGGDEKYASKLRLLGENLGLSKRLIWAGPCYDMPAVYNALDLLTSASCSEGFSNVIGEAMACGVPCVVTDVGDSAIIVGRTGIIVPTRDPAALAHAWRRWLNMASEERKRRQEQARARIEREFNSHAMVLRTERALQEVMMLRAQRYNVFE